MAEVGAGVCAPADRGQAIRPATIIRLSMGCLPYQEGTLLPNADHNKTAIPQPVISRAKVPNFLRIRPALINPVSEFSHKPFSYEKYLLGLIVGVPLLNVHGGISPRHTDSVNARVYLMIE